MPRKKRNLQEVNGQPVINPPERFTYIEGDTRVIGERLTETPTVYIDYAYSTEMWDMTAKWLGGRVNDDIAKWLKSSEIFKKGLIKTNSKGIVYKGLIRKRSDSSEVSMISEFMPLVVPLMQLFKLSEKERIKYYQIYRETQIVKLENAIKALKDAIKLLWNKDVNIPDICRTMSDKILFYQKFLNDLKSKRTGKHKLLYDRLKPIVDKLKELGVSHHKEAVEDLLITTFGYECDIGEIYKALRNHS